MRDRKQLLPRNEESTNLASAEIKFRGLEVRERETKCVNLLALKFEIIC